jgi:hypothetical protein
MGLDHGPSGNHPSDEEVIPINLDEYNLIYQVLKLLFISLKLLKTYMIVNFKVHEIS